MYGQNSSELKFTGQIVFGQSDIEQNMFGRIVLHPCQRRYVYCVLFHSGSVNFFKNTKAQFKYTFFRMN